MIQEHNTKKKPTNRNCGSLLSNLKKLFSSSEKNKSHTCCSRRYTKNHNTTSEDFKWIGLGVQFPTK